MLGIERFQNAFYAILLVTQLPSDSPPLELSLSTEKEVSC